MTHIEKAQKAAMLTAGSPVTHNRTEEVVEVFRGKVIWQGRVEVFEISGHPEADECYVWEDRTEGREGYVAVLGQPPIQCAQSAVKAYIVQAGRS